MYLFILNDCMCLLGFTLASTFPKIQVYVLLLVISKKLCLKCSCLCLKRWRSHWYWLSCDYTSMQKHISEIIVNLSFPGLDVWRESEICALFKSRPYLSPWRALYIPRLGRQGCFCSTLGKTIKQEHVNQCLQFNLSPPLFHNGLVIQYILRSWKMWVLTLIIIKPLWPCRHVGACVGGVWLWNHTCKYDTSWREAWIGLRLGL